MCVCVYKSNKSQHIKLGNVILDNEIVIKKVDNQNKKKINIVHTKHYIHYKIGSKFFLSLLVLYIFYFSYIHLFLLK